MSTEVTPRVSGATSGTTPPDAAAQPRGLRAGLRRFVEAAVTPLEIDDVLDVFHPLRAGATLRGRVVAVRRETADAATLLIRPGRDWAGHVPGQYLRVGVDVDGVRLWRTYSLTHGPLSDRCLSITVKAIPGGVVSQHLVHRVRPGQMVHLGQAEGDFVLPSPLPRKLLMVTAGSGITPVIGMLRNLFSRAEPLPVAEGVDIVLLHSALSRSEVIFGEELRRYAALGWLRLVELHTDTRGRLDVADLDEIVPDLDERTTYACGPVGLLDALEEHHAGRGLPLHLERFKAVTLAADPDGAGGGSLTFARSGTVVQADGATPILDAAESAGVLMPSGCRMGICFGCVLPLREGAVRDLRNGEITTAAPGDGVAIQTCISAAAGDCHLDH
ncbi:ferredoxin reductase [Nocardioides panaciterrulae]|uniref:Ferredoxin-NADP reductase n=1 Tax=Nocardioides panaciterrulae TaxID=661492 RepID=A0A7Y9J945_9ACTN|nr:ferredoxin reductase [Nocardioides panaciterrulae]NYD40207.1 ferredoxin-NADP reductase [Nocardioides panaciterrulae]